MKVVITARDFVTEDTRAIDLLRAQGYDVVDYSREGIGNGISEEALAAYVGDAEVMIGGLEPVGQELLARCPNLKLLSRRSIGYDTVDIDACKAHGVSVVRATGMVEAAVAEHVMAYILYFARELDKQNQAMHEGKWERFLTYGAKNRVLGLVGFGGIGKEIAKRAEAFGMEILYYCRHPKPEWEAQYHVRACSLDELLAQSDYISVNVPLTAATRHMFGAEEFAKMKKECVFINIARGPVVDAEALAQALRDGQIRGAGVDVYDQEPCTDSPLRDCANAVLTPHTAPYTSENFNALNLKAAENVIAFYNHTLEEKYRLV